MFRDSFSCRVLAVLRSAITASTSRKVESSFSVRSTSVAFRVAVSAASWSMRVKARVKDSSIEALSCSI